MQTENLIFTNWKERCSSLGKLLTNLPEPLREATEEDSVRIQTLLDIKRTGKNPETNRPNKWDDTKEKELEQLQNIVKRIEPKDKLPTGAITHLEEVFRHLFWKRRRFLENKYLSKGTICEEDALDLKSQRDEFFYRKNDEHLSNDFIQGTPDNLQKKTKDTKTNWDLESFDNAELKTLYEWQLKGYMWIVHSYDLPELETKTESELVYCLVNAPLHLIEDEKRRMWFQMGQPDDTDEEFRYKVAQLERNMIFDVSKFKKEYPGYDFYNPIQDFSIPPHMRLKSFNVTLTEEDIKHMTRRVTMAREWLVNKERETLKQIADGWQRNN
ncbi:hypothetical protein [Myroides odoratus]|uniref:Uncharacterized protein n=1 Tax=Myroides odoratus TaxID=256 RepID=A0A378RMW9_MYROD|nr:hypothetical protein [Myroides odoratus]QQU04202.1 hypothetical protein I6I89_02635 [Myroides odoratus]STZ28392.1 Uncharacterised protein [Myroides odoratus]